MEIKQTALEWLILEINEHNGFIFTMHYDELFKQAKAMEKEQIEKAYESGCIGEMWELNFTHSANQYYEKNYGK